MSRLLTLSIFVFTLSLPVGAFSFKEVLAKFEQHLTAGLELLDGLLEQKRVEYQAKIKSDEPRLAKQIAQKFDKWIEGFVVIVNKQSEDAQKWSFSSEFKAEILEKAARISEKCEGYMKALKELAKQLCEKESDGCSATEASTPTDL
ncbi:MAG: hypothetical protein JKY15_08500 [Deltaproteobacteria bacterium]|nr:hypothetical protein [Deltaproteobacteria bacterium]